MPPDPAILIPVSGAQKSAHMATMTAKSDPLRSSDAETGEIETNPAPQHLGTCNRCGHTYLLGTKCGTREHRQ